MNKRWRKYTAIVTALLFLSLSITIEFAHHHNWNNQSDCFMVAGQTAQTGLGASQLNSLQCVACLFGMTQLAPGITVFHLQPDSNYHLSILSTITYHFTLSVTHYFLRAPPQSVV